MKLIFIEGVSGVGKSTLAVKLCTELNEAGHAAKCYLEGDIQNPIDFYGTAYFKHDEYDKLLKKHPEVSSNTIFAGDIRLVRYCNEDKPLYPEPLLGVLRKHEFCCNPTNCIPIAEYTRVYKMVWEHFAQAAGDEYEYLIFDGSLLHHPVNDMLRNYGDCLDQIIYHVQTLVAAVGIYPSQIIYLSSDNIAERLQQARVCRGQAPPTIEQIRFGEKRGQMDLAILPCLSVPYKIRDVLREKETILWITE